MTTENMLRNNGVAWKDGLSLDDSDVRHIVLRGEFRWASVGKVRIFFVTPFV